MHHVYPPVGSEKYSQSWTQPIPPGHSILPLQLPPLRDQLAHYTVSPWTLKRPQHHFTSNPVFPPPSSRSHHDTYDGNRTCNSRSYDPPFYQRSLRRLVDLSNPIQHQETMYYKPPPLPLVPHFPPIHEDLTAQSTTITPSHDTMKPPKMRRRRRSNTVSTIPSCDNGFTKSNTTSYDPVQAKADDKIIMVTYYTEKEEPKKKRMRKAISTGTIEDYKALVREPDNPKLIAKLPTRDRDILKGFQHLLVIGQQITQSLGRREPISVLSCTERKISKDSPSFDYDSDGPPPLVIDLPEEDSPQQKDDSCPELQYQVNQKSPSPLPQFNSRVSASDPLPQKVASERLGASISPSYYSSLKKALISTLSNPSVHLSTPPSASSSPVPSGTPIIKGGKFQCKRCHKQFISINLLIKHRSTCLTKPDPHQSLSCTQCNKSFTSSKACSDHWKEYHSTERPHQCHKCGRRFTLARALEKHSWVH